MLNFVYPKVALVGIKNLIGVSLKVDCTIWQSLKSAGIAKTTRRGCRAGTSKQRAIRTISGLGRYSCPPNLVSGTLLDDSKLGFGAITKINGAKRAYANTTMANNNNLIYIKRQPLHVKIVNTAKPLEFSLLNVRSVKNKSLPVKDMIVERDIDILALTETWLGSSDSDNKIIGDICPTGYNCVTSQEVAEVAELLWSIRIC